MPEWLSVGEEVKGSGERKERKERGKQGTREQRKEGRKKRLNFQAAGRAIWWTCSFT